MEHSRLPIDVCEQVIDSISSTPPWWSQVPSVLQDRDSLLACAWTCSAWYPRARLHLYHTVAFERPRQVELFIRSIHENPSLPDLVRALNVYFAWDAYIPFAQSALFTTLRHLRSMVIIHTTRSWARRSIWHYPPHHHVLVTQYSLTDLAFDLDPSHADMLAYAVRIIWSLRELESLRINFKINELYRQVRAMRLGRVHSLRRPWSCAKLTVLTIRGSLLTLYETMQILPPCVFGTEVEQLAVDMDDPISEVYARSHPLLEQISAMSSLTELRLCASATGTGWKSISISLPLFLRSLPSPESLRVVSIKAINHYEEGTRSAFLSSLMRVNAESQMLPNLSILGLELTDDDSHDAAWWKEKLLECMPALRGRNIMAVKINAYTNSRDGWRIEDLQDDFGIEEY
ncbi:hypothetical protein K466DRAFT_89369 [Polyporus arcularius HHB13444]|uniref:F-box domain-containing protein n=1 Tax=Polyporus arcularius HHB13444 TaxID=1314778 RepID=A0A5C3PFK7_9APHY|nr:hypothetical protein K466DRAFT_89369 [Polyporus arcularius HHB13444]